jgi:hypothetical protein
VRNRSGVTRKAVVPPAQPSGDPSLSSRWPGSLHKDGTWFATNQHLHRNSGPAANALHESQGRCSQHSKRSRRLVMAREANSVPLPASILSGIPTILTPRFSQCPISGLISGEGRRDRRPRQAPLAREDIPHNSHLSRPTPPPGPEVVPNFDL